MAGVALPEPKLSRELALAPMHPSLPVVSLIIPEMSRCALPLLTNCDASRQSLSRPLTEENLLRESSASNSPSNNRSLRHVSHLRAISHLFLTRANSSCEARSA